MVLRIEILALAPFLAGEFEMRLGRGIFLRRADRRPLLLDVGELLASESIWEARFARVLQPVAVNANNAAGKNQRTMRRTFISRLLCYWAGGGVGSSGSPSGYSSVTFFFGGGGGAFGPTAAGGGAGGGVTAGVLAGGVVGFAGGVVGFAGGVVAFAGAAGAPGFGGGGVGGGVVFVSGFLGPTAAGGGAGGGGGSGVFGPTAAGGGAAVVAPSGCATDHGTIGFWCASRAFCSASVACERALFA